MMTELIPSNTLVVGYQFSPPKLQVKLIETPI